MKYQLELPEGAKIEKATGEATKLKATSDADPREFLLEVGAWPQDQPLKVTVSYAACVGETACYTVKQSYILRRKRDIDGGGARSEGGGLWDTEEFTRQALAGDKDGDGKLSKSEVRGLILPHFERLDVNHDGYLDAAELKELVRWLNTHHAPGVPEKLKK